MKTVLTALNKGLHQAFEKNKSVYLIGEDVLDPYGGAFKVSKNLSSTYPNRVLSMPISEHGFTSFAVGMALQGMKPIVEIMFGDFISITMDVMINTIPKLTQMYAEQIPLPILIRTPMGAGRGYGPTHSQSLEKFIIAIPGINTYAPSKFWAPDNFIESLIIEENNPAFLVEHKLQYLLRIPDQEKLSEFNISKHQHQHTFAPILEIKLDGIPQTDFTLIAYGYHADLASDLVKELAYEFEIFINLLIFTQLSPYPTNQQVSNLPIAKNALLLEEGLGPNGWTSHLHSQIQSLFPQTRTEKITSIGKIIPASLKLEQQMLLNKTKIKNMIVEMVKNG